MLSYKFYRQSRKYSIQLVVMLLEVEVPVTVVEEEVEIAEEEEEVVVVADDGNGARCGGDGVVVVVVMMKLEQYLAELNHPYCNSME